MQTVPKGSSILQDVQVSAKAQRRRFTAEYKMKIVREADGCTKLGEVGALLRREGLYSSNLIEWRRARDRGELLNAPKRGRRPQEADPGANRIAELERQNAKLLARAERAEALVELQKKVAALLGNPIKDETP